MAQRTDLPPVASVDAPLARIPMTYEEFQRWYDREAGRRGEWVDGEVIPFVAPKTIHQRISRFLAMLIEMFAADHGLGEVIQTPEMRLGDGRAYREPDLAFVAAAHADRITADGIAGPADLVIELVSDDSVRRDRQDKLAEYADAGIPEYWVIDPRPLRRTVVAYQLDDDGLYQPLPPDAAGRVHSAVLAGLWLDPAWLWQEPLPDPRDTLAEIASAPGGAL